MHLLAVHLVLCEVLHIDVAEAAQSAMQGNESELHTLDLHHLHQLGREMQTRSRGCHGSFMLGEDALEVLQVVLTSGSRDDVLGQRSLAEGEQGTLEFVVRTVVEEAECASAAGCVVYHFGHHRLVLAEIVCVGK